MLKQVRRFAVKHELFPAAFGRLCVETLAPSENCEKSMPAAFGRLCVETLAPSENCEKSMPAAFGRLCVETAPCCR